MVRGQQAFSARYSNSWNTYMPAHPQEVRCQELQEEGAQEVSGGVCFPDAQEGGVSGNGGKGEPGGHEEGGGVLQ